MVKVKTKAVTSLEQRHQVMHLDRTDLNSGKMCFSCNQLEVTSEANMADNMNKHYEN